MFGSTGNNNNMNDESFDSISTEDTSTGPEVPLPPTPQATTSMAERTTMPTMSTEVNEQNLTSSVIEICGLSESSNGRNCHLHTCCGEHVVLNDVLRLKLCVVQVENEVEQAIKLVKISVGGESCTVGFLPRIYYGLAKVQRNVNKNVQVINLYKNGSTYEKQKDKTNGGMASAVFLNDVPVEE